MVAEVSDEMVREIDKQQLRLLIPETPAHLRRRPSEKLPGPVLTKESRDQIVQTFSTFQYGQAVLTEMVQRADLELQHYLLSQKRDYPNSKKRRRQLDGVEAALERLEKALDEKTHVDVAARFYRYLGATVLGEERPIFRLDAGYSIIKSLHAAADYARGRSKTHALKDEPRRWLYARLAIVWPIPFKWSGNDLDKFNGDTTKRRPTNDVLGSSFVRAVLKSASEDAKRDGSVEFKPIVELWGRGGPADEDVREALKTFGAREQKRSRKKLDQSDSKEMSEMDRRRAKIDQEY